MSLLPFDEIPAGTCLRCGGDLSEPDHARSCDGQQGRVEAEAWIQTPTRTTAEAMALLQRTRRETIERARVVALDLIARVGHTHTRAVFAAMQEDGSVPDLKHHHWLGAVFRVAPFRWTGGWFVYSDGDRNIHERRIKTWTRSDR